MENVIITPHVAGASPRIAERHLGVLLDNVRRFAAGEPLPNVVNKQMVLRGGASPAPPPPGGWGRGAGGGREVPINMPEQLSDTRIQRFLADRQVVVLATLQPDGAPLATPMWFLAGADALAMISVAGLAKVRNLQRDPRCCVVAEAV